jgi:glyoxylase-like metal-dependent hydrolase (beta-lactamase superfamily II)
MKYEFFYDANRTKTVTVILWDSKTLKAAIIDSVLDYDSAAGKTYTESADKLIDFIKQNNLSLEWILETHIHADHLTASHYLKQKLGGKTAMGKGFLKVLEYWKPVFEDEEIKDDGSQFEKLFEDEEEFSIGNLKVKVINTPGHTPACVSYYVENCLFSGDTIFSPSVGTARTDFPGGSSIDLYNSIQKIFALPENTKIFAGHDYPSETTKPVIITTVKQQKGENILLNAKTSLEEFTAKREERQKKLPVPTLLFPALHVNLMAEKLPKFIKIPLNKILA